MSEGNKKRKNRKVICVIVILTILLIMFAALAIGKIITRKNDDGYITRNEWIEMLGEHMGAINYSSQVPYFDDVDENSEYFSCVQSAVEWGIIEDEKQFDGNDDALGKFVAVSAMKSIGNPKLKCYLHTDIDLNENDYLDIALDVGLIGRGQLGKGFSREEAEAVIEKLDELYYGEFWPKDLEEYEFQNTVNNLTEESILSYDKDANVLNCKELLNAGDVITFNDGEFVVARKVSTVLSDGNYALTDPEMEEVFETLTQSGVKELTFQDIVNYYGEENLELSVNESVQINSSIMVSDTIAGNVDTKGFKIEVEEDSSKLNIYVTDNDTKVRYKLPISLEISENYENFSASLDISKIFVGSQIDYSATSGVKYADVAVDIESKWQAGLAAEDEISDRIMLFETPVPLGTGLVGVDVQIYLVTTLSGEIYLEAELPFQSDVYYEKDLGVRTVQHDFEVNDPRVEITAEIRNKIDVAPILVVCEFAPIIDAEVGVGVSTKASIVVHDNHQICTDVTVRFPVADISVGQSDVQYHGRETAIAKLGLSGKWDIIDEDHALKVIGLHFEVLPDNRTQFVDECTYGKNIDNEIEDEVLNELIDGDFSRFAGTYKARESDNDAYGGGKPLADLELREDGSVLGGGSWYSPNFYPSSKPISVSKNEDGSYLCILADGSDGVEDKYYIYPEGVADDRIGSDTFLVDTVYIRCVEVDGGVMDIIYYKDDSGETSSSSDELCNTYITKDNRMPVFSIDYPDNWSIQKELISENDEEYEYDVLGNDQGVTISYYSLGVGFGSEYYGGAGTLDYACITKVADSSFEPGSYNGTDYSSLGDFVVAKIQKVVSLNGETGEGELSAGYTCYAVIPESYLGENQYCGTGYWSICSWEYVRPMVVIAEAPQGEFTSQEEEEVIQILSSFKRINE
ncbi:MAG: hypothetical protein ACI4DO_08925 [Roseburia sp.]